MNKVLDSAPLKANCTAHLNSQINLHRISCKITGLTWFYKPKPNTFIQGEQSVLWILSPSSVGNQNSFCYMYYMNTEYMIDENEWAGSYPVEHCTNIVV